MAILFDKKSRIVIYGAGKIAWSLGRELVDAGNNVCNIVSQNRESAKKLAGYLGVENYSDVSECNIMENDIFFLTVPDSALEGVADYLGTGIKDASGKLFVHLSGAKSVSLFQPLADKGALTASFHVMQTFPQKEYVAFKDCYASVETTNESAFVFLSEFAREAGLKYFRIDSSEKVNYHTAAVFAANFLNASFASAEELWKGLSSAPGAEEVLYPTVSRTLENIKEKGVSESLSGPVQRNDIDTIKKHIEALKSHITKDDGSAVLHLCSYITQSLILVKTTEGNGKDYRELKTYLKAELKKVLELI